MEIEIMDKKFLFFDIDGTLTTGGMDSIIPQSARQTLKDLRAEGHFVAIATGRPYAMSKDIAKELEVPSFVCNGGNTVIYNGEKIMNDSLNQEHVQVLIKECVEHDFPFCISQADDFYFLVQDKQKLPEFKDTFIKDFIKEEAFDPSKLEKIKRLMVFISREDQKRLTTFEDLVPQRYDDAYVMIEFDDKFKGISHLMKQLEAPIEDVIVFGDGENDIKMFKQAPISIAVGNAIDELKAVATYTTARSDEDGIRKACKKFGWIS